MPLPLFCGRCHEQFRLDEMTLHTDGDRDVLLCKDCMKKQRKEAR